MFGHECICRKSEKGKTKKMGKSWFAVVKKAFTPRPKQTKDEQVSTDP